MSETIAGHTQCGNRLIKSPLLIIDGVKDEHFSIQFADGFSDTTEIVGDAVVFVNVLLEMLKGKNEEDKIIGVQTSEIVNFVLGSTSVVSGRLIGEQWTLNTDQSGMLMSGIRLRAIASDLIDRFAQSRSNHS